MAKKQVLILNSDAAASSAFEAAKFGYVRNGATRVATLTDGDDNVSLFYGTANVGPISEGDVKKTTKIDYNAGTAQVSTATIGLDSSAAHVKIINTTAGTMNLPVKTFEAPATQATAAAAAAVIEGLMDTEFAKSSSEFYGFTAAVSGAIITITAPKDSHFKLAGNDASAFADTATAVPSYGTEAKVKQLEKEGWIDSGVWGLGGSNIKQPTSVVSGNYDILLIEGTKSSNSKAVGNAQNYDDFAIYVCVKDGNSSVTTTVIETQVVKLKA